jgi:hypothetical protein
MHALTLDLKQRILTETICPQFPLIGIDPIMILEGELSRTTRSKVFEWAAIHQAELRAN